MRVNLEEYDNGEGKQFFRIELHADTKEDAARLVRMHMNYRRTPPKVSVAVAPGGDFMGLVWLDKSRAPDDFLDHKGRSKA